MLHYLGNILSNGLQSLKQGIVNRCKLFSPWDYALITMSTVMPFILQTPFNPFIATGALWLSSGALLLLPRGGSNPKDIPESPFTQRVERIITDICNEADTYRKTTIAPDYIILRNPNSATISAQAYITQTGKNVLSIDGDLSRMTDEELEMHIAHELAHFCFKDPIAIENASRIFCATLLLAVSCLEASLIPTSIFCGVQFLILRAGRRYREYRADHYATLNNEQDKQGDPRKVENLNAMIRFWHKTLDEQLSVANNTNNTLDSYYHYLLHSYHQPTSLQEKSINSILHLLSSHPSPLYRIKR